MADRVVVVITWQPSPADAPVTEAYGPWEAMQDQSHMERIRQSLDAWRGKHGNWLAVGIYLVQPPYYYSPAENIEAEPVVVTPS